ncbi:MAG: TetR/AcrR family transcriptional regulator [Actinomycetes bacterium]
MVASPNRDRQTERREATRREIVDAAWEIARADGLGAVTLREVAARVGMRAPSLYSHVASKNAIFDLMFAQGWTEFLALAEGQRLPRSPRAALRTGGLMFFDFAVSDPARHQLLNQRTIPGFEPSPASYAPAVRALELLRERMRGLGVADADAADLFTALVGGFVKQQIANEPGGTRWRRLLERALDMFADEMGLPGSRRRAR